MSLILSGLPRVRRVQPQQSIQPNPQFFKKPVALVGPNGFEVVRHIPFASNSVITANIKGKAARVLTSTSYFNSGGARLSASSPYEISGSVSFVAYFVKRSSSASSLVLGGVTSGANGFLFYDQGGGAGSNQAAFRAGGVTASGSATWPIGSPILAVGTYDGSTSMCYVNGAQIASAGGGVALSYDTFTSFFWGGCLNGDFTPGQDTELLFMGIDNRVWSPAEIKTLSANPWLAFKPMQHIPAFYAITGVPVLSASTVTSITSTGATPRVTVTFS